jgi:hypothetical protein
MDYKSKYLKYKCKYIELLNQLGGAGKSTVPNSHPRTYSFLFMPLIYYAIDKDSVLLFDGFRELVQECIDNTKSFGVEVPFDDFDGFIEYLRTALNNNSISSIEDINSHKDGDYHIPGGKQEIVTNYNTDDAINAIISCIALILIERCKGQKFIYLK